MKTFIVKIEFTGIAGKYISEVEVTARDNKTAEKKAENIIGNRDGWIFSVVQVIK